MLLNKLTAVHQTINSASGKVFVVDAYAYATYNDTECAFLSIFWDHLS